MPNYSGYSDLALIKLIGASPEHFSDEYLHHVATAPDKQFKKQVTDTRTFQQYDSNNATAQRQIGSSAAGVMLPNNPYRAEAEQAVLENVANAMTDPMMGTFKGTKSDFLGNPKITSNKNASALRPKELRSVAQADPEDFLGKYGNRTAKYSPDGATVYENNVPIASYNFGDVLVVDPKVRRQGIGEELVYQYRDRYPDTPPASERTKASQALQEKVWERIERERELLGDSSTP